MGRVCGVLVRHRYRLYPPPGQRQALARVFGCARVVFNDSLRLREQSHASGVKISDTEVQHRVITVAKRQATPLPPCGREVGIDVGLARVPTSQICCERGDNDGPKPLEVRAWTCTGCGAVHDRDVNAARNILAAGRADRLTAGRGTVRPPLAVAGPGEAGTHRGAA
jgi:transposase